MTTKPKPAAPTVTKHYLAVLAARADIGQHEQPLGSNTGAFVIACQRATWLGGTGWPWCRGSVLKWRKQAGDKPGDGSAGAWDALERARKRGEVLDPGGWANAIPGDEVIWNVGSGHSSLLEEPVVGGVVRSIDGNSADSVRRCERPLSQVRGFIAWPETPGSGGRNRKPLAQVVGGESGRRKLVVGKLRVPLPVVKEKVT